MLFKPLRRRGAAVIILVIASFGASLALRSLIEFVFTSKPVYLTRELQIAMPLGGGLRATPDQMAMLGVAAVLVALVHVVLTRTDTGRAMRAVAENRDLARVAGVDVDRVIVTVWLLGGALACVAGLMSGLLVQVRPYMGFDLLLPLFAAAILGGIGSVPGAMVGGLVVGLCEALAAQTVGAEWRAGVGFVVIVAVLTLRPNGLFGRARMTLALLAYLAFFLTMALTYAIICLGLNVQWGQTGVFNVGVAGFVLVGAYASAILTTPTMEDASVASACGSASAGRRRP